MMAHEITRVRRDIKRRVATVAGIERLTPAMIRIHFRSDELRDFESAGPDDHVKLFIPGEAGADVEKRDYTPRSFDPRQGSLEIDFALHDAGPATAWATAAKIGDQLQIGGPRGSTIVADDFDWYLLIGDETAIPSIGRRLAELRPDVPVIVLALVDSLAEKQMFETAADVTSIWLLRKAPRSEADADQINAAIRQASIPSGDGYIWIAAESNVARRVREFVTDDLRHPAAWIKAAGYWVQAELGSSQPPGT